MNTGVKITDTIPRASLYQIFAVLNHLRSSSEIAFEEIRAFLQHRSGRKTPGSREAMWTVARDVLSELQRVGCANVGPLPRDRSDLDRLRKTPCRITENGERLAILHAENRGRAFDELLVMWLNEHPYFRALILRLLKSPLRIPDITSTKQLRLESAVTHESVGHGIMQSCVSRLEQAGCEEDGLHRIKTALGEQIQKLGKIAALTDLDAKKLVDTVQDWVVLPALLSAESLPFDSVTFQQILKISQEFYCGSWTTSHPDFQGRVAFATCEFWPDPLNDTAVQISEVSHHGRAFATTRFKASLVSAYHPLAATTGAYVDAYALRAIVCLELGIQPEVFSLCLRNLINSGPTEKLLVYTELPFSPSPPGESYIEIGRSRIGRLKLAF